MLNAKNFGATGDGKTKDTKAIQKALDTASQTGEALYIPEGEYLCGELHIGSNTELVMSRNTVLVASDDPADYQHGESFRGFLNISHAENICISGGRLRANDQAFWQFTHALSEKFEPCISAEAWFYTKAKPWRFHMLNASDSSCITISGMLCEDYPCYAYNFIRCADILLADLTIRGKTYGINTDGVHISSCKNVIIRSCNIRCGDDCIAIDSDWGVSGSGFTVSDCVLETSVHAFRFYIFGNDASVQRPTLSNITVTNCTVIAAAGIFDINARRGDIFNIAVSNVTAKQTRPGNAFVISTIEGTVRSVVLSGLTVNGNGCGLISADKPGEITDISLSNAFFHITPCPKHYIPGHLLTEGFGFPNHCHFKPVNFYIYQAQGVSFSNVAVSWEKGQFTDSWTAERREALKAVIAPITLEQMESKKFGAINTIDSVIRCEGCSLPDYDDSEY